MENNICTTCWETVTDAITLTDVDGSTRIICKAHTLSHEEYLASLGY